MMMIAATRKSVGRLWGFSTIERRIYNGEGGT